MFVVESKGRSGGLALLWNEEDDITIQNYSSHHITAKVLFMVDKYPRKFMGFYGHPDTMKRKETWKILRYLNTIDPMLWVCGGDFNEIITGTKKFGGRGRASYLMKDFKNTLEVCELHYLGYIGPKFTWNNGCKGGEFTKERFDRITATTNWCTMYPKVEINVGEELSSDHCPIHMVFRGNDSCTRRHRVFRYEARWRGGGKMWESGKTSLAS